MCCWRWPIGEDHGYAIMQSVTSESGARVRLGSATLYRTPRTLLEDDLNEESSRRDEGPGDPRRRYYRITSVGQDLRGRMDPGAAART